MQDSLNKLIQKAQLIMKKSHDPIHDYDHVSRVVTQVKNIGHDMHLSQEDIDILTLAAWWHDTSRTLRKKSVIWMVLCDDLISAIMLWLFSLRYGISSQKRSIATRIIWCKNATVGKYIGRVFLTNRSRTLLNILDDADKLDLIHIERMDIVREMTETSLRFHLLYRFVTSTGLSTKKLHMKTLAAQKYLYHAIKELLAWIKKQYVYLWHVTHYGKAWTDKMIARLDMWHTSFDMQHVSIV